MKIRALHPELLNKKIYTTHEAARLVGVTPITIIRWTENGKLRCFTTVGGHRRIQHDDLAHFAHTYHLPWPEPTPEPADAPNQATLLVVDRVGELTGLLREVTGSMGGFRVIRVEDSFAAGVKLIESEPGWVFLDTSVSEADAFRICRWIRQDARFKNCRVLAVSKAGDSSYQNHLQAVGANEILALPVTRAQLTESLKNPR